MEAVLNLDQLRALRGRARVKTAAVRLPDDGAMVSKFDPRKTDDFSSAQTQGVQAVHSAWAAQSSTGLGSLLVAPCELRLELVEQMNFEDFLNKVSEPAFLASFSGVLEDRVLLHIDLPIVFCTLDLLLGGSGKEAVEPRELTVIEGEVFEPAGQLLCRELDLAWRPLLKMNFEWRGQVSKSEASSGCLPQDKFLIISFRARVQESEGQLLLAFPPTVSSALLRKLSPQAAPAKPRAVQDRSRLREHLLEGRFGAELLLPKSTVSLRELSDLALGDVLVLKPGANEPVEVHVTGRHMFDAAPVRCGEHRGALIQKVLSVVPKKEAEATT